MIRRAALLTITTAVALGLAGIAQAKGPSAASVSGPGLSGPLAVTGSGEDGGNSALGRLTEDAGFFPAVYGQQPDPLLPGRPSGELGPRYTLTYTLPGPNGSGDRIRQRVYPYASGGPVTYMRPGQRFWDTERTHGGWYRAPATLKSTLVAAGLPVAAPKVGSATPPDAGAGSGGQHVWPYALGAGVAVAILLAAAAVVVARRRPRRGAFGV